jgi:glyoxylase I family protein
MPELTGVQHIALTVTDARRSADWYTRVLDLHEVARFDEAGGERHKIILASHDRRILIGLVEHRGSAAGQSGTSAGRFGTAPHQYGSAPEQSGSAPGRFDERRPGLDHLAFAVAGRARLDAWAARLDQLGVPHSPAAPALLDPDNTVLVFRDPDDIQLELFALPTKEN